MITSLYQLVRHPIVTVEGICRFIARPYPEVERDVAEMLFGTLDRKLDTAKAATSLPSP